MRIDGAQDVRRRSSGARAANKRKSENPRHKEPLPMRAARNYYRPAPIVPANLSVMRPELPRQEQKNEAGAGAAAETSLVVRRRARALTCDLLGKFSWPQRPGSRARGTSRQSPVSFVLGVPFIGGRENKSRLSRAAQLLSFANRNSLFRACQLQRHPTSAFYFAPVQYE